MTLYIRAQHYPNFRNERPRSYAIWLKRSRWRRREFVGYAWSFGRAYQAAAFLQQQWRKETVSNG